MQTDLKYSLHKMKNYLQENNIKLQDAVVIINFNLVPKNSSTPTPDGTKPEPSSAYIFVKTSGNTNDWYELDFKEGGNISRLSREDEPILLPPLSSPRNHYIRTDTKETVMLRGGMIPHFWFAPEAIVLQNIDGVLSRMKEMRLNWVVIPWNSGFAENEHYVEKLINTVRLAKQKYGLRVQLDLHSRGMKKYPDDLYNAVQIIVLDSQVKDDWNKLLSDPNTAFWLEICVDIFTVLSEAETQSSGGPPSFFNPILNETAEIIRAKLNNPNKVIAYTGGKNGWAGDASELKDKKRDLHENAIVVHPYKTAPADQNNRDVPESYRPDIRGYAQDVQKNGWNLTVGEFGWYDWKFNFEYMKDCIAFFETNNICYAFSGFSGHHDDTVPEGRMFIDEQAKELSPFGEMLNELLKPYIPRLP